MGNGGDERATSAKDEDEDDDVRVSSTGFVRVVPPPSFTGGGRDGRDHVRERARVERERERAENDVL